MRTTIRLDDMLLRRAKSRAAANGQTLNDFIADAVRAALAGRARDLVAVALPTFKGRGLQPGVDLDDSAALLDLLEDAGDVSRPARRGAERAPARRGARNDS